MFGDIMENKPVVWEKVQDFGLNLRVNKESLSPKRNEGYYCQEMCINRAIVTTALSVYCESKESVFTPVKCLDAIGSTGVSGLLWKKCLADKVTVHINDPHEMSSQIILENSQENNLEVEILRKDPCILLHETPFSFVHLDCHTDAAFFLDSVMRNAPKKGIVAITTKDDGALYGRTPDVALRNYGGVIAKTFYSKELAARLIIAGMARSAAVHSKGLEVLCVLSAKSTITIVVKILKGPVQANMCAANIKVLVHCTMCEDRAFNTSSVYILENPAKLLSCQCAQNTPGKVLVNIGPVWSGPLFKAPFVKQMVLHASNLPWSKGFIKDTLVSMLIESWCPSKTDDLRLKTLLLCEKQESLQGIDQEPPIKKPREDDGPDDKILPEPPFYYNLHKHSIKGPQMVKIGMVVTSLQKAGFRASRTHFDPLSVRTNAKLSVLLNHIAISMEQNTK